MIQFALDFKDVDFATVKLKIRAEKEKELAANQ